MAGFDGISTLVSYLISNPKMLMLICLYTIKYSYYLQTVKWFQVFLSNTNNFIQDNSFIYTK